jgi:hypothetical protein
MCIKTNLDLQAQIIADMTEVLSRELLEGVFHDMQVKVYKKGYPFDQGNTLHRGMAELRKRSRPADLSIHNWMISLEVLDQREAF